MLVLLILKKKSTGYKSNKVVRNPKNKNLSKSMRDILCLTSEQTSCRSCCVLELLCDTKEMLTVTELRKSGQNFKKMNLIPCVVSFMCVMYGITEGDSFNILDSYNLS